MTIPRTQMGLQEVPQSSMWVGGAEIQTQAPAHQARQPPSLRPLLAPWPQCHLAFCSP